MRGRGHPSPPGWLLPLGVSVVNGVFDLAVRVTHVDVLRRTFADQRGRRHAMAARSDTLAVVALLLGAAAFLLVPVLGPAWLGVVWGYVVVRVGLLVVTMLRVSLTWRYAATHALWFDESVHRVVMLALLSYLEAMLLFAAVYAGYPELIQNAGGVIKPMAAGSVPELWLDAFHLSAMTQMTVGYGDLRPLSWLRLVASAQVMVALLLLSLILAQFVSRLHTDRLEDGV